MFQKIRKWFKHRRDLREVMKMCYKIRSEKITSGRGCFFPPDEDKPLYEELVEKGRMVKEPLENGYMFREDYEAVWGNINPNDIHVPTTEKQS